MSMVPLHYILNIACNGSHFASVEFGSAFLPYAMAPRLKAFQDRFKEDDGFTLQLTRVECSGRRTNIGELIAAGQGY